MADMGVRDRRLAEQIEILFGGRGASGDRAVRLSDLSDMTSKVLSPIIAMMDERSGRVVTAKIAESGSDLRRQITQAKQSAAAAARSAATTETRVAGFIVETDEAITAVEADFAALETSVAASIASFTAEVEADIADISADLSATQASIAADLVTIQDLIDGLSEGDLDGDIIAYLAENYYSKTATDGVVAAAITALETSLVAQIEGVEATLITDYYTAIATDGAISTAISAASLELQSNIDDLEATLAVNYYTKAATMAEMLWATEGAWDDDISTDGSVVYAGLNFTLGSKIAANESAIGAVSADLSTNYWTAAETDGEIGVAIAGLQTLLSASIGDVAADLAANYYTQVETDGAITTAVGAISATLQANIDGLETYLNSTFYTAAETDGEIATAVSAASLTLQSAIDDVQSDLETNYYTAVETDGEITSAVSALSTTLSTAIDGVAGDLAGFETEVSETYATQSSQSDAIAGLETSIRAELNRSTPPTGFVGEGAHWTSDATGAPEDMAGPGVSWSFADEAAAQNLPTSTTGAMLATKGAVPVIEGDSIRITVIAQITGTGAGTDGVEFAFNWLDGAYANTSLTAGSETRDFSPGAYVSLSAMVQAPADALWCRAGVLFDGAAYAPGAAVSVRAIKVENLSSIAELQAQIEENFYTKVQVDEAIAGSITTYDAQIEGGIAANVTQSVVALADLNGSVARFSTLVSAGPDYNAAGIEVLAWDEEGTTGTAVRLLGDDVIVPGSLTAGSLTVTDGSGELIPNWNFGLGDLRGWEVTGADAEVVAKADGTDGLSTANARFVLRVDAAGGEHMLVSGKVAVKPGGTVAFGIEAASEASVSGATASLSILFYDKDDALLDTVSASGSANNTTWVEFSDVAEAPADAVYFTARINATPSATHPLYIANASAIMQRSGVTLITPNSITTDLMNVTSLSAISANIGLLRSAESGERVEITNDTIKVFDAAGTLRVLIGDLS